MLIIRLTIGIRMVNLKKELLLNIEIFSNKNKYSLKNNILVLATKFQKKVIIIKSRVWVALSNFLGLYPLIEVKRDV
jgi:hypothetical protein